MNGTFIDKLTKCCSDFDWMLVILYMSNIKIVGLPRNIILNMILRNNYYTCHRSCVKFKCTIIGLNTLNDNI